MNKKNDIGIWFAMFK